MSTSTDNIIYLIHYKYQIKTIYLIFYMYNANI